MGFDSTVALGIVLVLIPATIMLVHGLVGVIQTIYIWDRPEGLDRAAIPRVIAAPHHRFTVLVPAHHEGEVIGETLRKLAEANYPAELVEVLVVCSDADTETIAAATAAIEAYAITNCRVASFPGAPGKSRGLNHGIRCSSNELVTILDAEDDVSPDLLAIVNTIYLKGDVDVVQCGVQLMNYRSRWWAAHNVLEYFFWFKSRMHYYASRGSVPLGGNSVFFRRSDLEEVDGWDESQLTEDADIGIRLSGRGKRFTAVYDPAHVTREEVPGSVSSFVKQRTRWNQGFVQILRSGRWRDVRGFRDRLLLWYVLSAPFYLIFVFVSTPIMITVGMTLPLPVRVSLFSFAPLLLAFLLVTLSVIGLHEFGRDQNVPVTLRDQFLLIVTYVPYMVLLFAGAVRAVAREIVGSRGWEKTAHTGEHRSGAMVPQQQDSGTADVLVTAS